MRPTVPLLAGLAALLALPVLLPAQDIPESSPDAIRTHADGLDAYLANDYGDAISRFLRAHEQDPTFYTPLFMAYLSAENAGAGDRADSLFAVVQANRFRFSGYYRGRIDVHALARQGRMSEAIEVARRTMERYPGTKAAYNYAFWVRPRDPEEALRALARLDPDREPMEGWIGYWSVRGTALQNLGDYEGMLENARATAERFPDAIGALAGQAHALAALGHFDEMEEVLDRIAALDAEQEANQLGGVLRTAGSEARAHGHEAEGRRLLDRAVRWYEEEDTRSGASAAFWYGFTLYHAGRHAEARDAFEEAADEDPGEPDYRAWVAICEALTGEPGNAEEVLARFDAGELGFEPGELSDPADRSMWRALLHAALGNADQARTHLRDHGRHQAFLHRDPVLLDLLGGAEEVRNLMAAARHDGAR